MNTYHLKYFVDAVRLGGVALSAEHNHVTHSAVSQSIRALERELDIRLITHERSKFVLTDQGKQLFDQAVLWLQTLDSMKKEVKTSQNTLSGDLTIAAPQSLIREVLWKKILKFKKTYPQVKLKVVLGIADYVKSLVSKDRVDLGFLIDDHDLGGFQSLTLSAGKYLVVGKKNSVLMDREIIVTDRNRYEVQRVNEGFRHRYKKNLEIAFEIQSWSLIRQFVKDAGYLGLVPEYTVSSELAKGHLQALKLGFEEPRYEIKAIWSPAADLRPKVKAFLKS